MSLLILLFLCTLFLAWSNGANDNFKGVATLFGSTTCSYTTALKWATASTFAGSLFSIYLAEQLVSYFSGKGIVSAELVGTPLFLLGVAFGAGSTVMLCALRGLPISTTHSLIGGILGCALAGSIISNTETLAIASSNAIESNNEIVYSPEKPEAFPVNFSALGKIFLLPLILSPLLALGLAYLSYIIFRALRLKLGINKVTRIYIQKKLPQSQLAYVPYAMVNASPLRPSVELIVEKTKDENSIPAKRELSLNAEMVLDGLHFISAAMVCFARGVNDTPKIFALLLPVYFLNLQLGLLCIASAMALGACFNARKVAQTISKDITAINRGQGFTANIITALLVIIASKHGMPVSTTHVSVGSIFGIAAAHKERRAGPIKKILLAWIFTLPIAAFISASAFILASRIWH